MPTLTLKNLPRSLHRELKQRAKANHRSLNKETIATLETAVSVKQHIHRDGLEASVARARSYFTRPITAREIDRWKRAGRL